MEANEAVNRYTQDIRELSNKKRELQNSISELTARETQLKILRSKLDTSISDKEKALSRMKADEDSIAKQIETSKQDFERVKSQLEAKQAELFATEKQIQLKKDSAKQELKEYMEATITDAKERASKILTEATELSEKLTLEANSLHEATIKESLRIKDETDSQATSILELAEKESTEKRQNADEYYNSKIAKADKEYQLIMEKASEKHGQRINESIQQLATLNNDIETCKASISELKQQEESRLDSIIELENLISEKRAELDGLERLVLDKDNTLRTYNNEQDSELLHSLKKLEDVIQELTQERNKLVDKNAVLVSEHSAEIKSIKDEYSNLIDTLNEEHNFAVEGIKFDYETKLSDIKLELQNMLEESSEKEQAYKELTETCAELQSELANLKLELEQAKKDRDDYKGKYEELKNAQDSSEEQLTNLSATITELENEISKKDKLLKDKDNELRNIIDSSKTAKMSKQEQDRLQYNLTQVKGDFNKAVNVMNSQRNKAIELMLGVGIALTCMLFTFMFATGSMVYVGYIITALSVANVCWSGYKLYINLKLVEAMSTNVDSNTPKTIN